MTDFLSSLFFHINLISFHGYMTDYINNENMVDKISFERRKIWGFRLNNIVITKSQTCDLSHAISTWVNK